MQPPSPSSAVGRSDEFHPTLSNFLDFIKDGEITISPQIQIQELSGRGLGIVAVQPIKPGTELMWVPTSAILQPSSVPESFISLAQRGQDGQSRTGKGGEKQIMRTHALLAAWIAFGNCQEHEAWMATWPSLEEMKVGMPICWPEAAKGLVESFPGSQWKENAWRSGKESAEVFAILPWDVGGLYAIAPSESDECSFPTNGKMRSKQRIDTKRPLLLPQGLLAKQQAKLSLDIDSVRQALPHLADALRDMNSQLYASFLHAWLTVNSRCFYYIPSGLDAPEDSDEAMALCPIVDIFNHNDGHGGGCNVSHDDDGFTVTVSTERTSTYQKGEELFVSYGSHSNEMLWVEYGFLLDQNKWDSVTIPDQVVLIGLSTDEIAMLEEKGYLGEYTVREEGVCWRTEVVAWLRELTRTEWNDLVDGLWYPEESEDEDTDANSRINGTKEALPRETPRRRAMSRVANWVLQAREEAVKSLHGLKSLSERQMKEIFGDDQTVATQRFDITFRRWKQIWMTCMGALKSIEAEYPGSISNSDRTSKWFQDLALTVEQFMAKIGEPAH